MEKELPSFTDSALLVMREAGEIFAAVGRGVLLLSGDDTWPEAEDQLKQAGEEGRWLPVLLADSSEEQRGILAYGIAGRHPTEGSRRDIFVDGLVPISFRPMLDCLCAWDTGKQVPLDKEVSREVVQTPDFLLGDGSTFLLTWNPEKDVPMESLQDVWNEWQNGGRPQWDWSCQSVNKVRAGDRFFMLRKGKLPRGIIGSGTIRSDGWRTEDGRPYVDILWEHMVDPRRPMNTEDIPVPGKVHWSPQQSGIELPEEACAAIWAAWKAYLGPSGSTLCYPHFSENTGAASPSETPREAEDQAHTDEDPASSLEGRLIEFWGTRRERDPHNRARCVKSHGFRCAVCLMSFLEEYGEIGRDYIHVHHEKPLGDCDEVNGTLQHPEEEMKPVCPNCHAMLHHRLNARKGEVRSITELRELREAALSARRVQ